MQASDTPCDISEVKIMTIEVLLDDKKFSGKYCDTVQVRITDDLNIQTVKYVDVRILLEAFHISLKESEELSRIGELPNHFYDGLISREPDGFVNGRFITIVPPKITRATFVKTVYEVPFPALLFLYEIKEGVIKSTKVYALKGDKWDANSSLYNYPFGNVDVESHEVCWGYNELPKITSLKTLDVVDSLFIDSPCNNDHYSQEDSTTLQYSNLRGVFESLKKQAKFPEEILVQSDELNIGSLLHQE